MAKNKGGTHLDEVAGVLVALVALGAGVLRATLAQRRRVRPAPALAGDAPPPAPVTAPIHRSEKDEPSGIKGRLHRMGERVPLLGLTLRLQERFGELNGTHLAGAITLQAFLSLFPLLLVVIAAVGFVSAETGRDVAGEIIARLGLTGEAAELVQEALASAERSRRAASVVGAVGILWAGLGLVGALQHAFNQVWQVEGRGMKGRLFAIAWLLGAVLLFLASAVVTTLLGFLPGFLRPLALVVSLVTNVALWWWTAKILPNRDVGWRPLLPGAIFGGVGLEVLKVVGGVYVPRLVTSSSELYGPIGVVFAVLAWLFFFGRLVVYAATLNVVLWEQERGTETAEIEVPAGVRTDDVDRTGQAA